MPRTYPALELRWNRPPGEDDLDRLLAAVDDFAPTAIEERDDGRVRVFFGTAVARTNAAARLQDLGPDLRITPLDVSDEDWAARSQAGLGPVQVGRIVIRPEMISGVISGESGNDSRDHFTVTITPSMGFGTGHHASTRRCLALLQRVAVEGARVLDVGTGSGVLALVASRLGAREVVAMDTDPDALTAAAENLEHNDASDAIRLAHADLAALPGDTGVNGRFDLVLANLTGSALMRFAPELAGLLSPRGHLIASGFQVDEVVAVTSALGQAGLTLMERDDEDGWVGAVFERP